MPTREEVTIVTSRNESEITQLPHPSVAAPHSSAASPWVDLNVVCTLCKTPVVLPVLSHSISEYTGHCALCEQPISLQLLFSHDEMDVVELEGCHYAGAIPSAIPLVTNFGESTKIEKNPFDNAPKSFVDELLNHWEIRTRSGETFHFEYFSALRTWISDGRIKEGDEIIPGDGRRYRVEEYPGTADLFGNPFARQEARMALAESAPVKRKRKRRKPIQIKKTLALVLFAALCGAAPDVYQALRLRPAVNFIRSLGFAQPALPASQFVTEILNGSDHFRRATPEELILAEKAYLRALAIRPKDPEALASLAEIWIETPDAPRTKIEDAAKLIAYAKWKYSDHAVVLRAEARLLWHQGKQADAMKKLERSLELDPNDTDSHTLIARFSMASQDFVRATLHLDRSLQMDPTNMALVNDFVVLFEKQSKFREAAEYLRRLSGFSKDPTGYADQLANLYRKAGDVAGAEGTYRDAIRRAQNPEPFRAALVELLASEKKNDAVMRESLDYFSVSPNGEHALQVRAAYAKALEKTQLTTSSKASVKQASRAADARKQRNSSSRRR